MQAERRQKILIASLILVIIGLGCLYVATKIIREDADSPWGALLQPVGAALLTAGAVSVIWDRVTISSLAAELEDTLAVPLDGFCISKHGLRSLATGSFYKQVFDAMSTSSQLTIVQTWCPNIAPFLKHAEPLVARGGRVKIYLLDPKSPLAEQRSIDLGTGPTAVSQHICADTTRIAAAHKKLREASGAIELYYYCALPAFALYQLDSAAWVGIYWHGNQSDEGTTLVIDRPSPFALECDQHLKHLDSNATRVALDDL